jgi:hypothetical protein
MMGSPPQSRNGRTRAPVTPAEEAHHPGVMTRVAAWLLYVTIPIAADHLTAPLRQRARTADDRLKRTARRLIRRDINRGSTDNDADTR